MLRLIGGALWRYEIHLTWLTALVDHPVEILRPTFVAWEHLLLQGNGVLCALWHCNGSTKSTYRSSSHRREGIGENRHASEAYAPSPHPVRDGPLPRLVLPSCESLEAY